MQPQVPSAPPQPVGTPPQTAPHLSAPHTLGYTAPLTHTALFRFLISSFCALSSSSKSRLNVLPLQRVTVFSLLFSQSWVCQLCTPTAQPWKQNMRDKRASQLEMKHLAPPWHFLRQGLRFSYHSNTQQLKQSTSLVSGFKSIRNPITWIFTFLFTFMFGCFACVYVWAQPACLLATSDPYNQVYRSWESPCGCWELNLGPLPEQSLLFTVEPTLQSPTWNS